MSTKKSSKFNCCTSRPDKNENCVNEPIDNVKREAATTKAEPEEIEDCCICMEKIEKVNCCTTKCGHKFCLTCFVRYSKGNINAKCPLCRTTISDKSEEPILSEINNSSDLDQLLEQFIRNSVILRPQVPIPEGWEERFTMTGQRYYAHHATQHTQWEFPS